MQNELKPPYRSPIPELERVKVAAKELSDALTAYRRDVYVTADRQEVTRIDSDGREFTYTIRITEEWQVTP